MENNRKDDKTQSGDFRNEQNQTLKSPGASVADYGNVTGGSAVSNESAEGRNEQRSGENTSDTAGNP